MFACKKLSLKIVAIALIVPSVGTPPAWAGAWTGGATEWTQLANNFQLSAQLSEQVQMVRQLYETYVLEYQQLEQQILAGIQIEGITLADVLKAKRDLEGFQNALGQFGHDLQGLGRMFDSRVVEARLLRMPMEDYLRRESQKIRDGNSAAKVRLDRERLQLEQVAADIDLVDEYGRRVARTVGVHQATQLMNNQMNLLLQQITRMVAMTAEQQGSDEARSIADEAAARERIKARNELHYNKNIELRERDQTSIDRMRGYR
jgi:conjugal transfer/entry exclusion protein